MQRIGGFFALKNKGGVNEIVDLFGVCKYIVEKRKYLRNFANISAISQITPEYRKYPRNFANKIQKSQISPTHVPESKSIC